jgi:tetratricopeptide (TPR) repeat protein
LDVSANLHLSTAVGEVIVQRTRERAHIVMEETLPSSPPATRKPYRWMAYPLAITIALASAGVGLWKWFYPPPHAHVQVTLADFVNTTGDAAFDGSLKRALQIDLDQSPLFGVMGDGEAVRILRLMGRKSDDALTPETAREVCERANRDLLLTGNIAQIGSVYLLTLQASDCRTGETMASTKSKAKTKEEILGAIDSLADRMRSKLGESIRSRKIYDQPIAQVTTPLLEALKDFSIAESMLAQGKESAEILPYYQRAIQLDPQFAMAHGAMGMTYYNANEYTLATQSFQKAFDLRGRASAKESLIIEAHYYSEGLGDIEKGIESYQMWATKYPFDSVPWIDLCNNYTQLGQYAPAVNAGEHALSLAPGNSLSYSVLTRAYRRADRLADATSIGMQAVRRGKASGSIHAMLYEIAFWEHDEAAIARELKWAESTPGDWYFPYTRAEAALSAGKYKDAVKLFDDAVATAGREGLSEPGNGMLLDRAGWELEYHLNAQARATIQRIPHLDPDETDVAMLNVHLGDLTSGEHALEKLQASTHQPTIFKFVDLPRLRAAILGAQGKPLDAVAALEVSRPYELTGFHVLLERGEAYMQANEPMQAAIEFKKIVDNYGIDVIAPEIPLGHLNLARAYERSGNRAASRSEYEQLFLLWKNADSDLPLLQQARIEYARL